MKNRILLGCLLWVSSLSTFAQVPNQFAFQGVARNTQGQPVANQTVGVRFTIRQGAAGGTTVYSETHISQTIGSGTFNVAVGTGTVTSGSFSAINWNAGPYFLQVELDPAGGSNYATVSTTQLQSVPYAITAKNLEGVVAPQEGETLVYKNGQWAKKPKTVRHYIKGLGFNPSVSLNFIGPRDTITIEKDNPTITLHIAKALGSDNAGGGMGLTLNLGYKKLGGEIQKFDDPAAVGIRNLRVPYSTRIPISLSGSFQTAFKAGETYVVGMIGNSPNASTWDNNDYGMGYIEISY